MSMNPEPVLDVYPNFEKVSFEQFRKDVGNVLGLSSPEYDEVLKKVYDSIKLPRRSTSGSSGYDFFCPFSFNLEEPGTSLVIPTGIRATMPQNQVLLIAPRSGQGFKYRLSICNTIGVIDSDYAYAKNEGHIMIKIVFDGVNDAIVAMTSFINEIVNENGQFNLDIVGTTKKFHNLKINHGDAFAQGIFTNYFMTSDDDTNELRVGGFGSTDKK